MMSLLSSLDPFTLRIYRFLAREPLKSFYQRELARKLNISLGKTNRTLRILEKEELVLKEARGKITLYRYNQVNVVGQRIKILFTLIELNTLIRRLRESSRKIILYGSCAAAEDTSESDIDLLIVTSEKEGAEGIAASAQKVGERRLSPLILSPSEYSELKRKDKPLYREISQGIILWSET